MTDSRRLDVRRHLPSAMFAAFLLVIISGIGAAVIYGGLYNIGADAPHLRPTHWLIASLRDRSISVRAQDISVPKDLDDPKRVTTGAGLYGEMCSSCHLAPGIEKSELSQGLYPQAPELARADGRSPAQQFWIIKHGIKLTAMPAWGRTHNDDLIWDLVAFIRALPQLTPAQYQAAVKSAPADHDEMMRSMPGMQMNEGRGAEESGEKSHVGHSHDTTQDEAASKGGDTDVHSHARGGSQAHSHEDSADGASTAGTPLSASTAEPRAVVDTFFRALAGNDAVGASRLLDPAVLIYESGATERSREEYASHHMESDAAFLKTAKHRLLSRTGDAVGDLAWVASESQLSGTQRNKPFLVVSTETMVLRKSANGWRIVHIHWSSRTPKSGAY